MADSTRRRGSGSTAPHTTVADDRAATRTTDLTAQETLIGTDRRGLVANISWGAILAGVVTFLAVVVLLSLVTAGLGLGGASGTATGIWSAISLALALAAAGYVAGALAVRGGLLHGFLTWATSVVAAVVLVGWLGASLLGALGGLAGQITEVAAGQDLAQVAEDVEGAVDQQDVDQAEDQAEDALASAQQAADDVADDASTAAWWAFAGLLLGAVIAAGMGTVGAKSVVTPDTLERTY